MPQALLLRHPSSREHDTGPHPERVARIVAVEQALEQRDWLDWDVRLSPAVERERLEAVHDPAHVDRIERFCAERCPERVQPPLDLAGWNRAFHRGVSCPT